MSLAKELGEYTEEAVQDITEEMILGASLKVRKLYEKAGEDKKVRLSSIFCLLNE